MADLWNNFQNTWWGNFIVGPRML